MKKGAPFWVGTPLERLDESGWEALCDHCGLCCLHSLEDEESGEIHLTRIACRLYDPQRHRCRNYPQRMQEVPDCLPLRSDRIERIEWLPAGCAYRRVAEGVPLAAWHPQISGDPASVVAAGVALKADKVLDETTVDEALWQEYLLADLADDR